MTADEFIEAIFEGRTDFSGVNFKGGELNGLDGSGVNFTNADFSGADLSSANLSGCNLENANLSGADLSEANLENANLSGANLTGANFYLTNLTGTGFEHLRLDKKPLTRELKREITHTAYLETIRSMAEGHGRHRKLLGGRGEFADIKIKMEPYSEGFPFTHVIDADRQVVLKNIAPATAIKPSFMEGVVAGFKASKGSLIGSPLTRIQITVVDGQMHEADSSDNAFMEAAKLAIPDALAKARAVLTEPVYLLTVVIGEDKMGDGMTLISKHEGRYQSMESEDGYQFINCTIPYRKLADFEAGLKNLMEGEAHYSAQFDYYDEMPRPAQNALVEQHKQ
jgi:elongation factor G